MGKEWTSPRKLSTVDAYEVPEAIQAIERWPGAKMSAANKLAFVFLYRLTRGGLERVSVSGTMVGAAQGTSGDAGVDRLEFLKGVGLITVVDRDKQTGRWLLEVNDPLEVARAIRRAGDPQRLFDFLDELEGSPATNVGDRANAGDRAGVVGVLRGFPSAEAPDQCAGASSGGFSGGSEEAPEVPPGRLLSELSEVSSASIKPLTISQPSPIRKVSEVRALAAGGSSGGSAEASDFARLVELRRAQAAGAVKPPPTAASVLQTAAAVAARLPSREQQQREAEELCALILQRVNDPKLATSPAIKLAWEVVEGRIPRASVLEALQNLDNHRRAGTLQQAPGKYFVGCRDKLYRAANLLLPREQIKPR